MTNHSAFTAAIALASLSSIAAAQPMRDPVNSNPIDNGSNVRAVIGAFEKLGASQPAYGEELRRLRGGVGLVFVPGILGSKLKSKSMGEIWGFGMPDAARLALPADLVDPAAQSDVTAELAEEVMGLSLYGEAMKKIRANAPAAGISPERIESCGYDWRRDIRAGAADLERCIASSAKLKGITALVVVAHSMGGVVAWEWHRNKVANGRLASGVPVIAVAVLGSPLAGSCEIIRMIEKGYVQPEADRSYARRTVFESIFTAIAGMKDRFVNTVTSALTDDIRPLVLSWPGAISLSPSPAASIYEPNCAPVRLKDDFADPALLTHYNPDFWTKPIGVDLLHGKALPATYAAALRSSANFRSGFSAATLASPTYIYASALWRTPASAPVDSASGGGLGSGDWDFNPGDGRVPFTSAMPKGVEAADGGYLSSVHGNLPEDERFHELFFRDRLRRAVNGWIATQLLVKAKDDPTFLAAYAAAHAPYASSADFATAYEPARAGRARYPAYTGGAEAAANQFNDALCIASGCPTYREARSCADAIRKRDEARGTRKPGELASLYSASLRSGAVSDDDAGFLVAQRGLAMAQDLNWSAALRDLRIADELLESRSRRLGNREAEGERKLRIAVKANLGKALALRGFCAEAEPALSAAAAQGQSLARSVLGAPCYDRESGRIVALSK